MSRAQQELDTLIVGAGLAGLNCARRLNAAGRRFLLLDASDRTGGRVRTEVVSTEEGEYLVDRGFQVLLTAYPHATEVFDYEALDLHAFYPGAMVWQGGEFHRVADPRRRFGDALQGFRTPVATMRDKVRLVEMFLNVLSTSTETLWERPEKSAIQALGDAGFAETTIDRFFRPFFGGVFFDLDLETSSRMLEFCMRMFAQGRTCVPAKGMGELAAQLTGVLPEDSIRLNCRVDRLSQSNAGWQAHAGGAVIEAKHVVVATEGCTAAELLGKAGATSVAEPRWRQTATLAYATDEPPTDEAILVLDGEGEGPVNHLATMSVAASTYAPPGKHLVYANVVDASVLAACEGDEALDTACRVQLERWFGSQVGNWRLLRVDRIDRALPDQRPPWLSRDDRRVEFGDGLFACGDWLTNASIDGALASGDRCAKAVLATSS